MLSTRFYRKLVEIFLVLFIYTLPNQTVFKHHYYMKRRFLTLASIAAVSVSLYSFTFTNPVTPPSSPVQEDALAKSIKEGKTLYASYCSMCHQPEGQGIAGAFPPLAKSDYLMADTKRAISVVKNGLQGEITVNGQKYNNVMPAQALDDQQIAHVLNYVRNSWGNKGKIITAAEVKAVAKK
jgi:mono/diheme cytochrome c family protein